MRISVCIFILAMFIVAIHVTGQTVSSRGRRGQLNLFTDKDIYIGGEVIWFTGYIPGGENISDSLEPDIICIGLIDESGKMVVRKNYLMSQWICAGSLTLPDSLPPGNYQLIAYGNIVNAANHSIHFCRKQLVLNAYALPIKTAFRLAPVPNIDSVLLKAEVRSQHTSSMDNPKKGFIRYRLAGSSKEQKVALDILGNTSIKFSKKDIIASRGVLFTTTTIGDESVSFTYYFPQKKTDLSKLACLNEQAPQISISTDREVYGWRDSVRIGVRLTDSNCHQIQGIYTVACVLDNKRFSGRNNAMSSVMDDVLDTGYTKRLVIQGLVQLRDRTKTKKPMNLILIQRNDSHLARTDNRGMFIIAPEDIVCEEGRRDVYIKVNDRFNSNYVVTSDDPMAILASQYTYVQDNAYIPNWDSEEKQGNEDFESKQNFYNRTLESVTVTSIVNKGRASLFSVNECGDYVCPAGYFNCPAHVGCPENVEPIKGKEYYLIGGVTKVVYSGCEKKTMLNDVVNIYTSRVFYGMRATELSDTTQQNYLSTLYWKRHTSSENETMDIDSFYTSDQSGIYKIIVEGMTSDGQFFRTEKSVRVSKSGR